MDNSRVSGLCRELAASADTVAVALLARGLRRGDRVGIWAHNNVEWVIVQYATAR
jgi:fatty-acyl-CoA synthase